MLTLVIFPGFNPELWAERSPVQDSRWVPHHRAHTNKSHCPCAGGCRNAVTLLPFPPHHHHDDYYYLRLYFHPTQSRICHRMNELSFPSHPDSTNVAVLSPPHSALSFKMTMSIKKKKSFSSLHTFQGTLPPQISCVSVLCFVTKCFLSVLRLCTHMSRCLTAQRKTSNSLPHYRLLKEALCSLNQICWPESVSWST